MSAGIYIHIPFCRSRCSYCDFATDVFKNEETVERYVNALVKEIENFQFAGESRPVRQTVSTNYADTIYFGGGTPSLLAPRQLEKILDAVHEKFAVAADTEITMEMNPGSVSLETLRAYKSAGINRASFGAQTFDDAELKRLGRKHTAADVRETIELLRRADFENVSLDLIAGLPRQTLADWTNNLNEALKLKPEHLSLYLLEIHEGTPLAEQVKSRRQPQPDEDLAGEMYELTVEMVAEKGYAQYEISNFALPGFESKHNSKYWLCAPVFAFGVSAHSFDGARFRRSNERDTSRYVRLIEDGESPIVETSAVNLKSETVFLGLRLAQGIDLRAYENRFGASLPKEFAEELNRLKEFELIELTENNLRLTKKGFLFSNEVFSAFV